MRLQKEVLGQFLETVDSIICQFRQGGQNLRSGAWKNKWGISGVCSRPRKVAQETSQRWGGAWNILEAASPRKSGELHPHFQHRKLFFSYFIDWAPYQIYVKNFQSL